ncbi:hypothetical protein D0864_11110 [Hortaea werneckii]|uniref:Peptidase M14 carboxypeptidase A domain-containing protein n=1 Tax=Hortaea werneckii TaxID=91943 RepID=A0A3M7DYJ3_HORWE|nr:hypothetical protein D0864_11110 [Hortaea werneckii]
MVPSLKTALLSLTTLLLGTTTGQTIYTGDTLQGYPIISSLDITDVPSNTISRFWLSPAEGQGGLPYFLPIFVARGSEESAHSGKRLSLSASIHGDELNPVAVVQKIFARLNETGQFPGSSGRQHDETLSQPAPSAPYGATPTTDWTACSDSPSCSNRT